MKGIASRSLLLITLLLFVPLLGSAGMLVSPPLGPLNYNPEITGVDQQTYASAMIVADDYLDSEDEPSTFVAFAVSGPPNEPCPQEPFHLCGFGEEADTCWAMNAKRGYATRLYFGDWQQYQSNTLDQIHIYPNGDGSLAAACNFCLYKPGSSMSESACFDGFCRDYNVISVEIAMTPSLDPNKEEVGIALLVNYDVVGVNSLPDFVRVFTMTASRSSSGGWEIDPSSVKIAFTNSDHFSNPYSYQTTDTIQVRDIAITPGRGSDLDRYYVYWHTQYAQYNPSSCQAHGSNHMYSQRLHRIVTGQVLPAGQGGNCFDPGYNEHGSVYSTSCNYLSYGHSRLDVRYDPASGLDIAAVPVGGSTGSGIKVYALAPNSLPTVSTTALDTVGGHGPSIDIYTWNDGNSTDFGMGYIANYNTIGFKRYGNGMTPSAPMTLTSSGPISAFTNVQDLSFVAYNTAGGGISEALVWSQPRSGHQSASGTVWMALVNDHDTDFEVIDVAIAQPFSDHPYQTHHPYGTGQNHLVVAAASKPTSEEISSSGLAVAWVGLARDGSGNYTQPRYFGKRTGESVTGYKHQYRPHTASENRFGDLYACGLSANFAWTYKSNSYTSVRYDRCGVGCIDSEWVYGKLRLGWYFNTGTWNWNHQAYRSTMKLSTYHTTGTPTYKVYGVYMDDAHENNLFNTVTTLQAGSNSGSMSALHYPVLDSWADPRSTRPYHWTYWTRFPARYNYFGLYIDDTTCPSSMQSPILNRTHFYRVTDPPNVAPHLNIRYINWRGN